jgi:hypothetical protein
MHDLDELNVLDDAYGLLYFSQQGVEPLEKPMQLPEPQETCNLWHSIRCFFQIPHTAVLNKVK